MGTKGASAEAPDQPASRYWDFQSLELAIYLGAALILAGLCLWWVRHRLS